MIIRGTLLERCFIRRNASVIFDLKFLARPVNVIGFRDSAVNIFPPGVVLFWIQMRGYSACSQALRGVALKNIYPHIRATNKRKKAADYLRLEARRFHEFLGKCLATCCIQAPFVF